MHLTNLLKIAYRTDEWNNADVAAAPVNRREQVEKLDGDPKFWMEGRVANVAMTEHRDRDPLLVVEGKGDICKACHRCCCKRMLHRRTI